MLEYESIDVDGLVIEAVSQVNQNGVDFHLSRNVLETVYRVVGEDTWHRTLASALGAEGFDGLF